MTQLYTTLYTLATVTSDRLKQEQNAAPAVDYRRMHGLIAVVIVAAVGFVGEDLRGRIQAIVPALPGGNS